MLYNDVVLFKNLFISSVFSPFPRIHHELFLPFIYYICESHNVKFKKNTHAAILMVKDGKQADSEGKAVI